MKPITSNNITITNTELEAIRSVEHALGGRILPPKLESISEDVDKLTWLLKRLEPGPALEEVAKQPSRLPRIAGSARSSTPTPDLADSEDSEKSQDSADSDGRADTQENSEVQAEPEVVAPDSAEAA